MLCTHFFVWRIFVLLAKYFSLVSFGPWVIEPHVTVQLALFQLQASRFRYGTIHCIYMHPEADC